MKIHELHSDPAHVLQCKKDLEHLLGQPSTQEVRPCPNCDIPCPCSSSRTCTCPCSDVCEHLPKQLSSDPKRYPLEEKIIPLVFAFCSLRVCQPYWSCEGHCSSTGEVSKIPRVWFYSRSLIYARLIDDYLSFLHFKKQISCPWHLCLTYSSWAHVDTAFSIQPDLTFLKEPKLRSLQMDANVIASGLVAKVTSSAKKTLDLSNKLLANAP